jgi:hypothetical protein
MPNDEKAAQLSLVVDAGGDADTEETDRLTRDLLAEIRELDVESAELERGEDAPEGSKAAGAASVGALAVAVVPTLLPKLVEFLQAWSLRGKGRTVRIRTRVGDREVELEYSPQTMSPSDLKSLVDTLTETLAKGS